MITPDRKAATLSGDNGGMSGLLPLFPLQLVALPGNLVPLHIFEPRYREMIAEAESKGSPFGIVLAKEGGIVNAGCSVVVESVITRYPDGRLDIVGRGRRRFRLLAVDDELPHLRGEVEYFDDEDLRPAAPEFRTRAVAACLDAIRELGEEDSAPNYDLTDPELSFRLAPTLRDVDFLDSILRETSETRRLEMIIENAPKYVERSKYVEKMRHVAPTNGHGHTPKAV